MKLEIGNVKLSGNLILGPMAGVTDLPFRLLCKELGADLVSSEMVSAKGILFNNVNTNSILETLNKERPIAIQLFGSDPYIISEAAKTIEDRNFDILDINMGCPVPKVVNHGEGSALMKNPKLIGEIINMVTRSIKKPVTIKIRKGFNDETINAVEIAKIAEANGVGAIAVHGRTREEYYSGKADWNIIKKVKEAVKVPVIGSGDIFSPQAAKEMIEYTKCDGIMVARGARGNPFIFKQIKTYLKEGKLLDKPDFSIVKDMIIRHAGLLADYKGENVGLKEMRKHLAWYTTGYKNSSRLRNNINEIVDLKSLIKQLDEFPH